MGKGATSYHWNGRKRSEPCPAGVIVGAGAAGTLGRGITGLAGTLATARLNGGSSARRRLSRSTVVLLVAGVGDTDAGAEMAAAVLVGVADAVCASGAGRLITEIGCGRGCGCGCDCARSRGCWGCEDDWA